MRYWWLKLARYALPQWRGLLAIGVLMLVQIGMGLLMPWPLKLIVDSVLHKRPLPESLTLLESLPGATTATGLLAWLAGATVALFLTKRLVKIIQSYIEAGATRRMVYGLATDLFDDLQRRSITYHSKCRSGDLVRRVTADCGCVQELVMGVYLPVITSLVTLVSMFIIMWQLSRTLAILAMLIAIPLGILTRFFAGPMSERKYREKQLQGEMMSLAEQTLSSVPIVQAFGREDYEDERFRTITRRTVQASLRAALSKQQFTVCTGAVTAPATALVMAIGGMYVLQGSLTVGSFLVLLTYFGALYSPLETLVYLSDGFASASAGARRVLNILEADDVHVRDAPDAMPLPSGGNEPRGHIQFEHVTFGYEPDRPVLHDICLEACPGECIALVGPTGTGKSTLVCLVPRLFDPWAGEIRLDGVDVRQVKLSSLRANVAVVLQEPFLFPLSIADNIAYGRPGASWSEIVAAAEGARAHEFIERLPHGYDTVIGERGMTLSGGEKQRLTIARALLKDAPVLILDEPTSSLDAKTETELLEALKRLTRGRTTFIVSHRLSTVIEADRILVLREGKVVEQGAADELMATDSYLRHISAIQTGMKGPYAEHAKTLASAVADGNTSQ